MAFDEEKGSGANSTAKGSPPLKRAESLTIFAEHNNGVSPRESRLAIVLSTGFGIGYCPFAPGTLGAALGVGIYYAVVNLSAHQITLPFISVALFFAGVYLSSAAEQRFQEKDPGKIVIDEIASFPLTMLFISPSLTRVAVAFALNRAADILKPFPAGRIQKLRGGWGIMLDDTIAAIYANLLLRLLIVVLKI